MSLTLTDWAAQGCDIGGLCNPADKQEAREGAKQFDSVRNAHINKLQDPVQELLDDLIGQLEEASRSARTRDELRSMVEATLEATRAEYRNQIEDEFVGIAEDFYKRTWDALGNESRSHAWYLKQEEDTPPQGQQPHEGQPEEGPTPGIDIGVAAAAFFAANLGILVAGVHLTTRRKVIATLTDVVDRAEQGGLTLAATVDLFLDQLGASSINSQSRAARIARTLVIRASNFASWRAAQAHPLDWLKNWVSVRDARVRPAHLDTDFSEPIPLGELFDVGGFPARFPADPRLPPSQSINCRCVLYYIQD